MEQKTEKQKWYDAEKLVAAHYQSEGYIILHQNRTVPGGEIDIIAQKAGELVFVEVKAVPLGRDLYNHVTAKKLGTLVRTIERYCWQENCQEQKKRLDIVFVSDNHIIEIYDNVSF